MTPKVKPPWRNTCKLTIGCSSVSSQIRKATKPTAAMQASATISGSENQSCSRPMSSMNCNEPTQVSIRHRPITSIGSLTVAVSAGGSRARAATTQITTSGILIRKIQCQLNVSLNSPPMVGPIAGPSIVVIDASSIALGRCSIGKMRSSSVCASGITKPPHRPWPMRHATIISSVNDDPQSSENTPKPLIAKVYIRSEPKRPASQPVRGTVIASATE